MEASLTREEAEARAALLSVQRYDIACDLTGLLEGDAWRSTSTITFDCAEPGASTFVECLARIDHATLNGVPLDVATAVDGRLPLPALAATNVLVVGSTQTDTGSAQGVLRTVDESDKLVYVWTSFEPDDARRLWACFDQPDLKAVHAFTVTAPDSWLVTSNSAPGDISPAAEGVARVWTFPDTPPLSTYVVVVNAGPFHVIRSRRGGHDLGLYCRQSLARYLERDAEELFTLTEQGLAFYGERFGMPFPQERYDQVFVPNMGGAMENWGCVTWTDSMVYRSEPTYDERSQRAMVLLHEMAHMWFGDLVTMRWWDDLWLNEAFASWAATWSAARATEFVDAAAGFLVQRKLVGYQQDMSPATHPIRADIPTVAHAMANFDAITYLKGESVLAQLAAYVGEAAFVSGLRAYFAEHRWGNTVLSDLMDAVGTAAGRDLSEWTTAWLDRAGTDTLTLTGDTLTAVAPDGGPPRPHRFGVASFLDEQPLRLVATSTVHVSGARTDVSLPAADAHVLNSGDETFAATRSDPAGMALARARVSEIADTTTRAVVLCTAYDMLLREELGSAEVLEAMLSDLAVETSTILVEPLLRTAHAIAEQWTPLPQIPDRIAQVADVAAGRVADPDTRRVCLNVLALTASTPEQLELLATAARDDADLGWRLLSRRAELGDHDAQGVARLLETDPDPESWVRALEVTAATPDPAAKQEVWEAVMVQRRVPAGNVADVAARFWRPQQAALLGPYADRYVEAVRTLSSGALLAAGPILRGMVPGPVADQAWVTSTETFLATEETHPAVVAALTFALDRIRRQLAARAG